MRNFVPLLVVLLIIALALRVDFFVTVVYFLAAFEKEHWVRDGAGGGRHTGH